MRILISGQPNLHKNLGRPSIPFAPKSARIERWLLINADKAITQRELSFATNMEERQAATGGIFGRPFLGHPDNLFDGCNPVQHFLDAVKTKRNHFVFQRLTFYQIGIMGFEDQAF